MSDNQKQVAKTGKLVSSDKPITGIKDDLLDRSRFSNALAAALDDWSSPDSLVVGLHAPWGQGKTSVKNFVLETLAAKTERWTVVDFNPWQWASYGHLNDAFFDEVAVAIGKQSRLKSKDLAARWRSYAARLKGIHGIGKSFAIPIQVGLVIVSLLSVLDIIWQHRLLFFVAMLPVTLLTLTGLVSPILEAASEIVHPSGKDTEQSLESVRRSLAASLRDNAAKILVVVDDLDRLSPKALAEMVQLIKANGDLPNLLYLLIGDREVLANHLSTELHVNGHSYLEKIVQVSLDLPSAPRWRVQKILFEGLDTLLVPKPISDLFQPTHWQEVFPALAGYFKDLRNVNRFLSTLEFNMSMYLESSAFEVNAVDLIALEAIRLFEPKLYRVIQLHRSSLLGEISAEMKTSEQAAMLIDTISEIVTDDRREQVKQLLPALFPVLRMASQGYNIARETQATWSRDLRIGSVKHFDKYFEMLSDPRELSNADVQTFLSEETYEGFLKKLHDFADRKLLDKAIVTLREYDSVLALGKIPVVLRSMFDVGDQISREAPGMFSASPFLQAEFFVGALFDRLPQESALDTLQKCIEITSGLILPIEVAARTIRRAHEGMLVFSISKDEEENLKALIVSKIEKASINGGLERSENLRLVLFYWKEWSGSDVAVRSYTKSLTSSQNGVVLFLKGMVLTAHSSVPNKKGGSERYYIRMDDVNEFASKDDIDKIVFGEIDVPFLQANAEVLGLYQKAAKRRQAGKGDYGLGAFDDDEDDD